MPVRSTEIANLVQAMLADGAEHEVIVSAVEAAELKSSRRAARSIDPTTRGARLPTDWQIPETFIAHAAANGMAAARIQIEAERFKNYWTAKSGQGAIKRDWFATWRNWILTAMEGTHAASLTRNDRAPSAPRRAPTGADAVLAGMGRLAHRLAREREPAGRDGTVASSPDDSDQLDLEGKRT
jgi:hypothetical protein